jgi:uncharacterized Zn finger protein
MAQWWRGRRVPKSPPRRPAEDGIQARSRRGGIGETWWSRRFVAALEALADPRRLTRGRSYARSGQVMDLAVGPGAVTSRVQGSRRNPYDVAVEVRPFTTAEWSRAEEAMAEQALFLAALLAGEMPHQIEDAFRAAGLSLFPTDPDELSTSCSCPDWGNPCKHVAASLYILAERFDEDPFLIFAWRGLAREDLLARLRERRAAGGAGQGDPGQPEVGSGGEAPPLTALLERFWDPGPGFEELSLTPRAPAVPDAVLRQLGPLPFAIRRQPPIHEILSRAYEVATREAERRAREGG